MLLSFGSTSFIGQHSKAVPIVLIDNLTQSMMSALLVVWLPFCIFENESDLFFRIVVVTRPLSWDGGMAEDHGAPETGQLPGSRPKVVERQRVAKD